MFRIIIEEGALLDLLLPAIECAVSPIRTGKVDDALEVGGVLWGSLNAEGDTVSVRKASVVRLGEQATDEIEIPDSSVELMQRVAGTHWPHLSYLGSFHSHPFLDLKEDDPFILKRGHKHSETDKDFFRSSLDVIDLIVTLVRSRKGKLAGDYLEVGGELDLTTLVVRLADVTVMIKAYRKTESGRISSNLRLLCPAVNGMEVPAGDVLSPFLRTKTRKR